MIYRLAMEVCHLGCFSKGLVCPKRGFKITHITGWRAYLGTAQHNYSHWTRVALPEGRPDMEQLEGTPGVLPFEVYSQAPLRLISWCSFELPRTARKLLRELAEMCELPETTTQALVTHIAAHNSEVKTEQEATQYLATLATVTISSRTKLLNYTTMVQHFLGTLQLPLAVYMLDYYLPMLSPNEGYNETGLTMQSAGPIRQPSQPIALEFLFKGSEFGHWKVKGGQDAFAFRHPSLGKTEVFSLLASDAHHHKVSPIGTGRLIAMVGTADALIFCSSCLGVCLVSRVLAFKARRWHIPFQWDALLDYSGYSYVCYGAITSGVDLRWHCCPTTTMFAEQIVPSCTATDAQQQLCLLSRLRLVAATTMFAEQAWPFGA